MASRKRNKGKERKPKKAEVESEKIENRRRVVQTTWQCWAGGGDNGRAISQCNHGCNVTIPDDNNHPVCGFMDIYFTYFLGISKKTMTNFELLMETFNSQPKVWKIDNYRHVAIDILVSIGTNLLLKKVEFDVIELAKVIVFLENFDERVYNSPDLIFKNRGVAAKLTDFLGEKLTRDALKFFRKRTSCKCLKGMHLEARKTQPKLGVCCHCDVGKERSSLMVCSRCGVDKYCSKQCQIAAWPEHKGYCDVFVSAHDQRLMRCKNDNRNATTK